MAVRNPTVPAPPRPVVTFDLAWKKFNADEEYSLLKCPHAITLMVKEYSGAAMMPAQGKSTGFLNSLGLGGERPGDRLSASAAQAHELARFLRDKRLGFEAYVLHMRSSSIVTVGGFDSVKDDALARTQQRLATLKFSSSRGGVDPIGLIAHPFPIPVPREEKAPR
jgi:hypothetical protein